MKSVREKYLEHIKTAAKKARKKGYIEFILRVDIGKDYSRAEFDGICADETKFMWQQLWDLYEECQKC